jgi:PadR family transcriptional regulator, regulatory protein PadR
MKSEQPNSMSPMSAAAFHVLLALASQDLHGYGIIQEVARLSNGQYRIGPGTLYDNLKKLINSGWVKDSEEERLVGDEKRRMYRLTEEGRNALKADVSRMKSILRVADRRLVREDGGA